MSDAGSLASVVMETGSKLSTERNENFSQRYNWGSSLIKGLMHNAWCDRVVQFVSFSEQPMTPDEIAAALRAAFHQCDAAHVRLNSKQKEILQHVFGVRDEVQEKNPLDELTGEERHALFLFVQQQERQKQSWKATLLNDWLQGRDSGLVQFLRDRYGIQWLEQIQANHLLEYDLLEGGEVLTLKVGDRIEVMNGLWEWVQIDGPCSPEWFPCTVISVRESDSPTPNSHNLPTSCIVRFDSGAEYEIQGLYEWNRPNWRWAKTPA